MGLRDARAQVVGHDDRGQPPKNSNAWTCAAIQWGSAWRGKRLGVGVVADAPRTATKSWACQISPVSRVDDRDGLAGEVDEQLLARAVLLAHDEVEPSLPAPVVLGRTRCTGSRRGALAWYSIHSSWRVTPLPAQLAVDDRPSRAAGAGRAGGGAARPNRRASSCASSRSSGSGQPRPARLARTRWSAHGGTRAGRSRSPAWRAAQALAEDEAEDFSDLAHGGTGAWHRHLSSGGVNAFQASVRCPGRLTPALLTTYPRGWPLPVKQGGRFRRNRVAKTREIRRHSACRHRPSFEPLKT